MKTVETLSDANISIHESYTLDKECGCIYEGGIFSMS